MPFSNVHLIRIPQEHNNITGNCFCENCKRQRLEAIINNPQRVLQIRFLDLLPEKESITLDKLFSNTLDLIVQGHAYKHSSLHPTGYRYFKSWAKQQEQFRHLTDKEMTKFCQKVNESSAVYRNWNTIAVNLGDPRIKEIDARRLSVNQFYRAISMEWCLSYDELLRSKGKQVDDPQYTNDKFDNIFQYIVDTGLFDDIEYSQKRAAAFGERLKIQMIKHCR